MKHAFRALFCCLLLSLSAWAAQLVNGDQAVPIPNSGTGTVLNQLVQLVGAQAQVAGGSDTNTAIGVCVDSCGTTGNASVSKWGLVGCQFDNAHTAGHIAIQNGQYCHDNGSATEPTSGNKVLGLVLASGLSTAVDLVDWYADRPPAAGGGSTTVYTPVMRVGYDGGPVLVNGQIQNQKRLTRLAAAVTLDVVWWQCDAGATTFKLFKRNAGTSTALTGTLTPGSSGTVQGTVACASNGGTSRTLEGNTVSCGSLSATALALGDTLQTDGTPTADGTSVSCSAFMVAQ